MDTLFVSLTDAMSGAPAVALAAAFVWGVLSIVLSPCHLASIPLIVGFLQGGGAWGALLFGLVFGVALGPCTFGFMAPVLGVTFSLASSQPVFAGAVLALFGLGHCAVIGAAGFSSSWVQRWLAWQEETPGARWLRRGCGVAVLAAGAWLVLSVT